MDFDRALDNIIKDNELKAMGKLDYNKSLAEIISDKERREQKLCYERRRYAKRKNWSNWRQWSYTHRDHRTFQKKVFNYTLMIYKLEKNVTNDDLKLIFEESVEIQSRCSKSYYME
ncbi:uncharacterized protein LOC119672889 isoform X2 [Teleopsis dalmanni]|uniref:uncharacterized protein LOC119672889 isoform X2 n=1 Tax=Teleopsis dalmanni TaxID=139649 RepID=UPI0018CCFAC9|nr:uncharacterized protein LOC119672889 isoform X2 [Teleopsis dalmanni]